MRISYWSSDVCSSDLGWAALAVFIPLALSSNDMMMKKLGRNWKPLQRSAYAAAVLTLLHWMFIHNNFVPALAHFAPLVVLAINRVVRNLMHVGRAAQCDRSLISSSNPRTPNYRYLPARSNGRAACREK